MFAIAFDMVVALLEKNYGEPYNNAYYEIKHVMILSICKVVFILRPTRVWPTFMMPYKR